jgi:hypothetical protein
MLLQWLLLNFGFRVDKIPREDSSTKIVQSSNFLPVVMDEILRTAPRTARTRFFQIPRDASLTRFLVLRQNRARGTGVVKIQTNKISWQHWQWDRNREVDTKHIDVDYGFGLLTNVEKITESPELLAIWSAMAVARHFSGRRVVVHAVLVKHPPSLSLPVPLILPHAT